MDIYYKTLKTPKGFYVYDRQSNKLLQITEEVYNELNSGKPSNETLQRFQVKGFLLESKLEKIEHPDNELLKQSLNNKLEYLLLQVTQECNLRCHYCVYGGGYENRTHSSKEMDFETAKKAIDFYVDHSRQSEKLSLGFYGGEPLLKMDMIKECVRYIKSKVFDRKISFNMTTNGTLLTLERAKYLYENGFNVVISLDGAQEDHDKNRVFKNSGLGSFDCIMKNLIRIKEYFPEFLKDISFNTVLNYNCDFSCVKSYYNTNEIVKDANSMFNLVEENGARNIKKYSSKFVVEYRYEQFLLFMYMLKKVNAEVLSHSQLTNLVAYKEFYNQMKDSGLLGKKGHHNGPCIPGGRRLFVSCTGEFYPCERVPEEPVMQIGNIKDGFDYDACERLLNIGRITEEQCKKCWAFRLCSQCAGRACENGELSKEKKLKSCKESKAMALDKLRVICMLKEFQYDFEEE